MLRLKKCAFRGDKGKKLCPRLSLKYILILIGLITLVFMDFSDVGRVGASEPPPDPPSGWNVAETPVAVGPGDQIAPAVWETTVVYNDLNQSASGWAFRKELFEVDPEPVAGPVINAGPTINDGAIAWQGGDNRVCRKALVDGLEKCVATAAATELSLSGERAVITVGNGSSVRLVDFRTLSSKYLDSSSTAGSRSGPVIEGDKAAWVRERGYAGLYYEPIIYATDLVANTFGYVTKPGGGHNTGGVSKYSRQNPTLSGGRIFYQQKINEAGNDWNICEATPDTFGDPLVAVTGDQVSPSASGDLIVYQDNRTGHFNEAGNWVADWNIYLKDLSTGLEQPVCVAPGDQIKPVLQGNTVVWQDNRNGDWDIYAATLSTGTGDVPQKRPNLTLSLGSIFWRDYQDYLSGDLTVRYRLNNDGDGLARNVTVRSVSTEPAEVIAGALPAALPVLDPGQTGEVEIRFNCPAGTSHFTTRLTASCSDAGDNEIWFPVLPAVP